MDWTHIPPLNSLRAFCALVATMNYSRAAAQLNVTPAAVRQQIKALEAHLDISLVERHGRGMRLTRQGVSLGFDLEQAFSTIERSVDTLTGARAVRPVKITTSPAFATEWLMPRITEFQKECPEITLLLNPTADIVELIPGGVDVGIRYANSANAPGEGTIVLTSDMIVVAASGLVDGQKFEDPAVFKEMKWLEELGTSEVTDWFRRRRIDVHSPLIVSQMPGNLIMQAVRRGDGITYTARAFFTEDIAAGQMQVLHSEPAAGCYYLEINERNPDPRVRKFVDWLMSRAETVTV